MAYQLTEINQKIQADPKAFLAECDASYQKRLEDAADRILAGMAESPVVLLSGPSGSGTTSSAVPIPVAQTTTTFTSRSAFCFLRLIAAAKWSRM